MKKILLCCSAGMSTSMLVKKMRDTAKEHKVPVEIDAVGLDQFEAVIKDYDVALLGPQVKYKFEQFSSIAKELGKKVEVIDSIVYGQMNGKRVLSDAIKLIKS